MIFKMESELDNLTFSISSQVISFGVIVAIS